MPIRSIRSDVSNEPGVFSIPDMSDRYYVMPMLDGWSEVFEVASSRTTGGHSQIYVITGPGWSGALPQGVTQVKSPTGMVWILGRIYSSGTPEDYAAVHALQDKFSVVPLSAYGKPYTPPQGRVDPGIDMKTAVRKQVNDLDIDAYFNTLAELMKTNPPPAQDAPIVARMAEIGLVPGRDFDPSRLGFLDREVIRVVPKLALLEMGLYLKRQKTTNGWLYFTKRRKLGHQLLAAGHGQSARSRLEPPAGRGLSVVAKGCERRRVQRRRPQLHHPLRKRSAAACRGLLVADDVRFQLLLRARDGRIREAAGRVEETEDREPAPESPWLDSAESGRAMWCIRRLSSTATASRSMAPTVMSCISTRARRRPLTRPGRSRCTTLRATTCPMRSAATTSPRGCRSSSTPMARLISTSRRHRQARIRRPTGCRRLRAGNST